MELFLITVLFTVTVAQQSQMVGPQNTLSVLGSNVTLKCSTLSGNCNGVDWEKSVPNANPETVFSDRAGILSTYRDRYSIDNSSGCDLVINNVKLKDSGRFTCKAIISQVSHQRSADLTVIATQPKCAIFSSVNDTMEGDKVQLRCEVLFSGIGTASMLWKGAGDAPTVVKSGNTIARSFSVLASVPDVPSFTCVTLFKVRNDGTTSSGLASNVPSASCETPVIKVLYSVRNVTLSPSLSYYIAGTTITCTARGNPPPGFKWQVRDVENAGTWMDIHNQNSSEFSVSNDTCRRYRCEAMNVVRGKRYNATSDEFQVNQAAYSGVGFGSGFGIGLLAAILLSSIAFMSFVRFGYLEFHRRPVNQPRADVAQPMNQERSSSSHQLSSIPVSQESAYTSLGNDRDTNKYESLEQRQKAKPKKSSTP